MSSAVNHYDELDHDCSLFLTLFRPLVLIFLWSKSSVFNDHSFSLRLLGFTVQPFHHKIPSSRRHFHPPELPTPTTAHHSLHPINRGRKNTPFLLGTHSSSISHWRFLSQLLIYDSWRLTVLESQTSGWPLRLPWTKYSIMLKGPVTWKLYSRLKIEF